jgi:hypothetical protein
MKYYHFRCFFIVPKKGPEFAPDKLRRNAISTYRPGETKKSPDSVVNQSFS